jgi:predicted nucleotidyltransferase component of viral defense system
MLHYSTVDKETYKTLKEIFRLESVNKNFALAGGTSLSLQIGHRISIDLDIFNSQPFNTEDIQKELEIEFEDFQLINRNKSMLFSNINLVKCDFVHEPARLLYPFLKIDGVNYFSIEDIAAMKLHTVCGRGKRKYFFDVYCLLQLYSWDKLQIWFEEKYNKEQLYFLSRSIKYFADAEEDPEIIGLNNFNVPWNKIRSTFEKL